MWRRWLLSILALMAWTSLAGAATTYFQPNYDGASTIFGAGWDFCPGGTENINPTIVTTPTPHTGTHIARHQVTATQKNAADPTASSMCWKFSFTSGPGTGSNGGMLEGYYSAWLRFGADYAPGTTNQFHNTFNFFTNRSGGGNQVAYLNFSTMQGVLAAQWSMTNCRFKSTVHTQTCPTFPQYDIGQGASSGFWGRPTPIAIPRDQWVHFEVYYKAARTGGIIRVWQDIGAGPVLLFDFSDATKTGGPSFNTFDVYLPSQHLTADCSCVSWTGCPDGRPVSSCYRDHQIAMGLYTSDAVAGTETLYIDDVLISSDPVGGAGSDTTPPAAPTGLTLSAVDHDSMTLTWTAPGDADLAGYDLDFCTGSTSCTTWADFAQLGVGSSPYNTATTTLLQPNTIYRFRLRSFDEVGCTATNCSSGACPAGSCANATTTAPPVGIAVDSYYSAPYQTQGTARIDDGVIDANGDPDGTFPGSTWASAEIPGDHWIHYTFSTPQSYNTAEIFWAFIPSQNKYATAQQVLVQQWTGSAWTPIATLTGVDNTPSTQVSFATTSFPQLRLLQPGTACGGAGCGNAPDSRNLMWVTEVNLSLGADVTPPAAPTGVTVTGSTSTTITLTWTPPTDPDLAGYRFAYCSTAACTPTTTLYATEPTLAQAPGSTYTLTGLTPGQLYRLAVRAKDGTTPTPNASGNSNLVEVTLPAAAPVLGMTHWRWYTPGIATPQSASQEDTAARLRRGGEIRGRLQVEDTGGATTQGYPLECAMAPDGTVDTEPYTTMTESCASTGLCLKANGGVTNGETSTGVLTLPGARSRPATEALYVTNASWPSLPIALNQVIELEYDLDLLPSVALNTAICCRPVGVSTASGPGPACLTVVRGSLVQ